MAVYAIGDIQGCYNEFRRLLDQIDFSPGRDRLWLTGDLVNRGPGSLETLRFVRSLGHNAVTVLGNHDLHLLAVAAGSGRGTRSGDTLTEVLGATDRDELLAWLRTQPLLHEDPMLGFAMVHAGLPPQWDMATARALAREVEAVIAEPPPDFYAAMYGDFPNVWDPMLSGVARLRFAINCFTRLRFCTRDGQVMLRPKGPPETAPADALPWYAIPERKSRGTRLLFGHWSALGYRAIDDVYSLDTGCVWGGELTALRIDTARPGPRQCVACAGVLTVGALE